MSDEKRTGSSKPVQPPTSPRKPGASRVNGVGRRPGDPRTA